MRIESGPFPSTEDGPPPAYEAFPYGASADGLPAVIVLHDIFGVSEHTRDVARRIAQAGYYCLAPDLYWDGDVSSPLSPARLQEARSFYHSRHVPGQKSSPEDHQAALDSLESDKRIRLQESFDALSLQGLTGKERDDRAYVSKTIMWTERLGVSSGRLVSILGFCFGGSIAFSVACAGTSLASVVVFYGRGPRDGEVVNVTSPVLGLYAASDLPVTSTVEETERAMRAEHKAFTSVVYEDGVHAFFDDSRSSYRLGPARDAWARSLEFLRAHGAPSPEIQERHSHHVEKKEN